MDKKLKLTYKDIDSCAKRISFKMNNNHFGVNIVTFTKGGLFSSGFICNYLNWKPTVLSVNSPNSIDKDFIDKHGSNLVLIDDILDTGKTYIEFVKHSKIKPFSYFLVDKPTNDRISTPQEYYSPMLISDSSWIIFPWEISN